MDEDGLDGDESDVSCDVPAVQGGWRLVVLVGVLDRSGGGSRGREGLAVRDSGVERRRGGAMVCGGPADVPVLGWVGWVSDGAAGDGPGGWGVSVTAATTAPSRRSKALGAAWD